KQLQEHHGTVAHLHLRELFAQDPARGERMVVEGPALVLDCSKHRLTDRTISLLIDLADECGLSERIEAMFRGEHVNVTEDRPALHVALRMPRNERLAVDGVDVVAEVHGVLDRMATFADGVRSGTHTGATGARIRNVVTIGIGGSDLGPVMAYEALRHFAAPDMTFRFVSNIDGTEFVRAHQDLGPDRQRVIAT